MCYYISGIKGGKMKILKSTWFNVLMLIFLPIIGIITTWFFSNWSVIVKVVATVLAVLYSAAAAAAIMGLF